MDKSSNTIHQQNGNNDINNDDIIYQSKIINTDNIIRFISDYLKNIIKINKDNHLKQSGINNNDPLYNKKFPKLTIEKYLIRIKKYTEAENNTIISALILIERFIKKENYIIGLNNIYRILLGCTVLAIKLLEDIKYDNSEYCQIGGLSLKDFNDIEYNLFIRLDFNINISYKELEEIYQQIQLFNI